jgi:hypothetical protein
MDLKLDDFSSSLFEDGNCSKLEEYRLYFLKEKILYENWGKLQQLGDSFQGYCWIPKDKKEDIDEALLML